MATLASAKAKYSRKTGPGSAAVTNYNESKGRATANWGTGMANFLGRPVKASRAAAYSSGMSAAVYSGGDPEKWERNYLAAM